MVSIIYSEKFLSHPTGRFHPERPQRLTAIVEALHQAPFAPALTWLEPTPWNDQVLSLVQQIHTPEYLAMLANLAQQGGGLLDADTPVAIDSYDTALLAVSAWLDGVDRVLDLSNTTLPLENNQAFVLARPPGHHAESSRGMGFCLFSNAAIAAHYALGKPGINRVAILDWDVHHGNGTQAIIQSHPRLAYCSLHQSPAYPGTGYAEERGDYQNVLNIPLSPGSSMTQYQPAFVEKVIPFLTKFAPDLLIISAGYDAAKDDPLAAINLLPEDYATFTKYCLQITPKIVFGLEGGYHLQALAASVVATIQACFSR